jgi:CDP-glycerol glycerophosphotransferase (TagB/SpsB family)
MHIVMLAWVRDHPDVVVTLRPHPFLFGTLVDREVLTASELAEWRDAWQSLPNTHLDVDGDVAELFAATDLLVTDGISFLAEYPIATGKPAVFIEHQGHWHFSPIGELAANAAVRLNSFEEFVDGFEFIREAGLPDRSAEIEDLRLAANPYAGQVAARMIEIVAADAVRGPAGSLPVLVDPALITETAWELQPGREPVE